MGDAGGNRRSMHAKKQLVRDGSLRGCSAHAWVSSPEVPEEDDEHVRVGGRVRPVGPAPYTSMETLCFAGLQALHLVSELL